MNEFMGCQTFRTWQPTNSFVGIYAKHNVNMRKITIAIDGLSSCGKSTLAKALAKRLGYIYGDSGAMYRAATLYFLDNDLDWNEELDVKLALKNIQIHFENIDGKNTTFLNGKNVEDDIRTMRVSESVSPVATISTVRRKMVSLQQEMGKNGGIVMDGRDIGTVVFPNAELKLFITASADVRTQRRYDELLAKGWNVDYEEIKMNLLERDHIDSTRADSPLKKADDAVELDNSDLDEGAQLGVALELAHAVLEV